MIKHTDHINLTNDELLTLAYMKDDATALEIELAQRLEATLEEVGDILRSDITISDVIG